MRLHSVVFISLVCLAACGGDDASGDASGTGSDTSNGTGPATDTAQSGSSGSTPDPSTATGDGGSSDDMQSTGIDDGGSSDSAGSSGSTGAETTGGVDTSDSGDTTGGCVVLVDDQGAIGTPCGGPAGLCPKGYECLDPGGIVPAPTCQIPCEMDCECADPLTCNVIMGKAGVFNVCGGNG